MLHSYCTQGIAPGLRQAKIVSPLEPQLEPVVAENTVSQDTNIRVESIARMASGFISDSHFTAPRFCTVTMRREGYDDQPVYQQTPPAPVRQSNSTSLPAFSMAPLLGYWNIRGLCQYIRFLLEHTGTEYEEKRYVYESEPSWPADKFILGLDFPNLPYYIDGDTKITQSLAIMYYIGRKNNMAGRTEEERVQVDMLVNQAYDMRIKYSMLAYFDFEEKKGKYLTEDLPPLLKMLSEYLGNKSWVLGDQITIPDFIFYEVLDNHLTLEKTCLDNFKNLQDYVKRFEELPAIKKYMASPNYIKSAINMPFAQHANK